MAFVVAKARDSLMRPSPKGPGKVVQRGKRPPTHQIIEESSHFGHTQWHHHRQVSPRLRLNSMSELGCGGSGWCVSFFPSCSAWSGSCSVLWARSTVRKACASIQSVMCRYQPCQERTSYSSRPTSSLPTSKHCSTVQRAPMTRTISSSVVPLPTNCATRWCAASATESECTGRYQGCWKPLCTPDLSLPPGLNSERKGGV